MNKFITPPDASELIKQISEEYTVIQNPDYIFPSFEIVPLAAKITSPREKMQAVVMDMDGTTTTTEELCLHSLEYMLRQISGRFTKELWHGLDQILDYPNIIGNSTTKHVEFLITRYHNYIKRENFVEAYFYAALWTVIRGRDDNRKKEVQNNFINLGCGGVLTDEKYETFVKKGEFSKNNAHLITNYFLHKYGSHFKINNFNATVRAGIDIYYQRYHEILQLISEGRGSELSEELLGGKDKHLIEPMPGIGIFLALIKGWLGEDVKYLFDELKEHLEKKHGASFHKVDIDIVKNKLITLSRQFEANPLKVAIVTSSIYYEADIVLSEVFKVLSIQVDNWKIPSDKKKMIKQKFQGYKNVFDGFVTASDSNEIRLKPYRDLYSIALHQLDISKLHFSEVVGFEDSESGTIAIRAAGIGLCVALPFTKTQGHDLSAASYILSGGIPEVLLYHNLFLK